MLKHKIEKRPNRVFRPFWLSSHPALFGRPVKHGEVELLFIGVEIGKEVKHLIQHLISALILLVHLVDDHDRLKADFQSLLQHKLGLRHWPFSGIHQNDRPVHHVQNALHLAAKVSVARGVHNVDAGVFPLKRGYLGKNGDAALALKVVGIHGPLGDPFVGAIGARGFQELVDQGGFAVVNVGDNGNIAHGRGGGHVKSVSFAKLVFRINKTPEATLKKSLPGAVFAFVAALIL